MEVNSFRRNISLNFLKLGLDFCSASLYNENVIRSPVRECGLDRAIQPNRASSLLCKVIHTTKHSGLFFLYRVLKCLQTLNRTARSYQLGTSRVIAETNFDSPVLNEGRGTAM
nr:MAG TPA: hypothetical protein [Bacteriophage sp.]